MKTVCRAIAAAVVVSSAAAGCASQSGARLTVTGILIRVGAPRPGQSA